MGLYLSPRYGQVILVSVYPVLTALNWWQHCCAISFLLGSRTSLKVWVNIGFPVVRTDGRSIARCTVTWLLFFLGWVDGLSYGAPPTLAPYLPPLPPGVRGAPAIIISETIFNFLAGGSPYPLLNNAEVMSLLKTGHRMEKPDLCSDNL